MKKHNFFRTHDRIGEVRFETLDKEGKTILEGEEEVLAWLKAH